VPAVSIADLTNAKLDVDHIATISTSTALTAIDRLGNTKDTIAGAVYKISAFNDRGPWVTARSYAFKDLVSNGGTWYVCVAPHASGATFAGDVATKWRVYQGVTASELAAPGASATIGHTPSGVGAEETTVKQALDEVKTLFSFMTPAQIASVKARSVVDVTSAIQAAINHGGFIWAKAGLYTHGTLDFKGKSVIIFGDGEDKTEFKSNATGTMFDMQDVTDQPLKPLAIRHLKLNGAGTATAGIKTRYRHKTDLSNLTIININGDCLNELDSWNNLRSDLTLYDSVNGVVLQGANNNCKYSGLSISGNSQYQIKIENGGTVPGGSTALSFDACDVEYASGFGVYVNTTGVVRFNDSYLGERIDGAVFDMVAGTVIVSGGVVQYGNTPTSHLGNLGGGKLLFKGTKIEGGEHATVSNMFTSGNGRASIEDSPAFIVTSDAQVMAGDCLDYGKTYDCFAPKLGRQYTGFCLNGTFTSASTENERTVTCATVTGSPCLLEVNAPVVRNWIDGSPGSLVITYKSSKPCSARLTQSPVGITPAINIAGTLPATTTIKTAVFYNWTYTAGVVPLILEIFQTETLVGDSLTVYEVFLSDSKNTKVDSVATFYNLAKC
jgi:hypothetical protein